MGEKAFQLTTSHAQLRFLGFLIEFDISEAKGKDNLEWFIFSGSACYWVALCECVALSAVAPGDEDHKQWRSCHLEWNTTQDWLLILSLTHTRSRPIELLNELLNHQIKIRWSGQIRNIIFIRNERFQESIWKAAWDLNHIRSNHRLYRQVGTLKRRYEVMTEALKSQMKKRERCWGSWFSSCRDELSPRWFPDDTLPEPKRSRTSCPR